MSVSNRNLSLLGFEDYFKLKYDTEEVMSSPQQVTEVISQHDKDKVSYKECYDIITGIIKDNNKSLEAATKYNSMKADVAVDTCGVLIRLLVTKGVIKQEDENAILAKIQELYKLNEEGN